MIKAAAKATQLRASLLAYTDLHQVRGWGLMVGSGDSCWERGVGICS